MTSIIPVPTSRVGDLFVRQRLAQQVQSDQLALFRLQNQVSSGQRIQLPSEDAPAALRAINLQRLLDRKGQINTNLQASNLYLGAAENTLHLVSKQLSDLRGEVIAVSGTLNTDSERQAAVQQIDRTLQFLVDTANAKSQGRYLFSGSRTTTQPYRINGGLIEYLGNDRNLKNYVDLERLFDTNVPGTQVFGGVSQGVEGTVDLDPHLSADTLLSTINGGSGISRNAAIAIHVNTLGPTSTSVVDLSKAATLGDVARLIEANAPLGATLRVDITGSGLTIQSSVGTISISEVAEGRAARELGILTAAGTPPTGTITGDDLNPRLTKNTELAQLLGTKAHGRIASSGPNNDLLITAAQNGVDFNGVTVVVVAGGVAGSETVDYDDTTKTLTIEVQEGVSSAAQVAAAISAEGTFTATVDYHDATSSTGAGSAAVEVANFGVVTSGGSGDNLDLASGLAITHGGEVTTLDVSNARTIEDLLNRINGANLGLLAEINSTGTGLNVRSRLSGADLTIGENGGTTATQLGIRTYHGDTKLAEMNRGVGVPTYDTGLETVPSPLGNLSLVARNGTALNVPLAGAGSLEGIIDAINSHAGNNVGGTAILAQLNAGRNGIELVDSSAASTGPLTIQTVPGSQAAEYLGLLTNGQPQLTIDTPDGNGDYVAAGRDVRRNDLVIVARDGAELWIDLTGTKTVQDVIDRINNNPANTGTTSVTARLASHGNGISLVDASANPTGNLTIRATEGSQAAEYLGFLSAGQTESDPTAIAVDADGNQVLKSEDRHTLEVDSVFNTLIRLRTALETGDVAAISREIDRLDADASRVNFARAEIGARLQNLEVLELRLADENIQLRSALSTEIDVDLVEAISNLTARQYAFQASLQTASSLLQISLLNFI